MKWLLILLLLLLLLHSPCFAYDLELDRDFSTSMGVSDLKTSYDAFMDLAEDDSLAIQLGSSFLFAGFIMAFGHEMFGHGAACRKLHLDASYDILNNSIASTHYEHQIDPIKNNYIVIGGLEFQTQLKQRYVEDILLKQRITISDLSLMLHSKFEWATIFMKFNVPSDLKQFTECLDRWHLHNKLKHDTIKRYALFTLLDPLPLYGTYFCLSDNDIYEPKRFPRLLPSIDCQLYPEGITNAYSLYYLTLKDILIKFSYEEGITWEHRVNGIAIGFRNLKFLNFNLKSELKYIEDCAKFFEVQIGYKMLFVKTKYYYNALYSTDFNNISIGVNF